MSRYKMIAREDLELHAKNVVAELEKERARMYRALDIIPVTEATFEHRDALNLEIAAGLGEQRAWRKMCEWVAENYKTEVEMVSGTLKSPHYEKVFAETEAANREQYRLQAEREGRI